MKEKSWVVKFYANNGENQTRTLIYIKGDNMKIVTNNNTYIYNSSLKQVNFINPKKESYWLGSIDDFKRSVTQLKIQTDRDFLIQNISFLKNMNSLDRDYFQRIINHETGKNRLIQDYSIYNNFNIRSTPNFTSISDFVVRKYEVLNKKTVVGEIWIAENLLSHMDWKMSNFKDFLETFFFHSGVAPYFNLDSYMKIRKNGLPMKVIIYPGKEKIVITMDHASKIDLDEKIFSIPKSYQLVDLSDILKMTD